MTYDAVSKQIVLDEEVSWLKYAKQFIFYLYDGQAFFGMDETKVHRVRGEAAKLRDKIRIKRYIAVNVVLFALLVVIMKYEIDTYNTVK